MMSTTPQDVSENVENPAAAVDDDKDEYDHIVSETLNELSETDEDDEDDDESSDESSTNDDSEAQTQPKKSVTRQSKRKQKSKERYDEMVWKSRDAQERADKIEYENSQLKSRTTTLERDNTDLKNQLQEITHLQEQLIQAAANPEMAQSFLTNWQSKDQPQSKSVTAEQVEEIASKKAEEIYQKRIRSEQQKTADMESAQKWKQQVDRVQKEHSNPERILSLLDSIATERDPELQRKNVPLLRSAVKYKYAAEALYAASKVPGFKGMSLVDQGATLAEMHAKIVRSKTAVTKSEPTGTARSSGGGKATNVEDMNPTEYYAWKYRKK